MIKVTFFYTTCNFKNCSIQRAGNNKFYKGIKIPPYAKHGRLRANLIKVESKLNSIHDYNNNKEWHYITL